MGAEQSIWVKTPCPKLKIRFRRSFATVLNETIESLSIFLGKIVYTSTRCIAETANEKLHTNELSILGFWALFSVTVENLGEIFAVT